MKIFKHIKPFVAKYEPEILIGMGISGLIFSTVWGIKATFKASKILEEEKVKLQKDKLTFKESFKKTWKLYIPVAVSMGISVPAIISGNRISNRRNMALAAAYTLSETALQEYKDKTKEIVGDKKEQEIHEAVSKENVQKTYGSSQIILTGDGESLFYEPISDRYFKSSWNKIERSSIELNARAVSDLSGDITLSEWYDKLGLPRTELSDDIGWSLKFGAAGLMDISIDSSLTPDNVPCGSIYYRVRPKSLDYKS